MFRALGFRVSGLGFRDYRDLGVWARCACSTDVRLGI